MLTDEQKAFYEREGYLIVSGLFSTEEVEFYKAHCTYTKPNRYANRALIVR